jgi:hypothetical protein
VPFNNTVLQYLQTIISPINSIEQMRKVNYVLTAVLLSGLLFYSCEKSVVDPVAVAAENNISSWMTAEVSDYFIQRGEKANTPGINESNGATFIEPFTTGEFFGVFDPVNFAVAGFGADYDQNDFWRENPDGSVTLQLRSNNATGEYFEFFTGVTLVGDGAHMRLRYSGFLESDTFIVGPNVGDTIVFNFLTLDPSLNALVLNGHGEIVNAEDEEDVKDLRLTIVDNPGGGGQVTYSLD